MGALISEEYGRGYDLSWTPVDGDEPDSNSNISNPKSWLKRVLYDHWDQTRENYMRATPEL